MTRFSLSIHTVAWESYEILNHIHIDCFVLSGYLSYYCGQLANEMKLFSAMFLTLRLSLPGANSCFVIFLFVLNTNLFFFLN